MKFVPLYIALFFYSFYPHLSLGQRPDLTFTHYNSKNGLSKNFVWKIFQDHRGMMWFATENGLNKFDGYTFKIYENHIDDNSSLSSSVVRNIYEDSEKNIWIATVKGINLYNRQTDDFTRIKGFTKQTEVIYEDHLHNLWVSTNDGALYTFDRE